jgi:glutathione S-transferase
MTSVKLFIDHASQPSRAILVFCRINKIPHEIVETRITKGEVSRLYIQHLTPEFAKINPNRKLPAIMHGDFNLSESHSIMRYLARTFNVPEHWYPPIFQLGLLDDIRASCRNVHPKEL